MPLQVRAKYMTLEAHANRYVHYLGAIRAIQDHLVQGALACRIPTVNNTNVDRSVATIHGTVLACLRRQAQVLPCALRCCLGAGFGARLLCRSPTLVPQLLLCLDGLEDALLVCADVFISFYC